MANFNVMHVTSSRHFVFAKAFEAAQATKKAKVAHEAAVRHWRNRCHQVAESKVNAKVFAKFKVVMTAAVGAWGALNSRAAQLTAELVGFVEAGCRDLTTKEATAAFAFSLQRFAANGDLSRVLTAPSEVISLRPNILRKDAGAYDNHPEETPDDYRYGDISVVQILISNRKVRNRLVTGMKKVLTQVSASRLSSYLEETIRKEQVCGVTVERFTPALIKVRVGSCCNEELALDLLREGVWAVDGEYYLHYNGKYLRVGSGMVFRKTVSDGAVHYGATSTASNGQIKVKEITLYAENLPGFDPASMLNELTFGLVNQLKAEPREARNKKQVAQLSTRLAQITAPAVEGKRLHVEAYYMGIYNPLWDGQVYLSDTFVSDWVQERLGNDFRVLPSAVMGLSFQARPHMVKGNSQVLSREALEDFLMRRGWEVDVIERGHVTRATQKCFNKAIWSKGKDGRFGGHLVILCDSKEDIGRFGVEMFTDLNGLKETFDLRTKSGLNVLDMTAREKEIRHMSTQTLATYCVADYGKTKRIFQKAVRQLLHKEADSLGFKLEWKDDKPSLSVYKEAFVKKPSSHYFDHEGVRLEETITAIAPLFNAKVWHPGFKREVNSMLEAMSNTLWRCSLDIEGSYGVITVDPAIDYGFKLLKVGNGSFEVLAPALEDGQQALLNRFPMANCYGQSKVTAVSKKDLIERVRQHAEEKGVDFDAYRYLVERIRAVPEGVVVVPASQPLMNKHDGWDFDGDHVNLVTDKEIVALYDDIGSMIVDIVSDDEKTDGEKVNVALDANVTKAYWRATVASPNPSVGEVINAFQVFSSVLVDAKAWKAEIDKGEKLVHGTLSKRVFATVFGNVNDVKNEYNGLVRRAEDDGLHVTVSNELAACAMNEMTLMEVTPDNVIRAAQDMQAIARLYAETVIDAAKTGVHVTIPFLDNLKKILPESRQEIQVKVEWDNDRKVRVPYDRRKAVENAEKYGKSLVRDIFFELRVIGLQETARVAQELVAFEQALPESTLEWISETAKKHPQEVEAVSFVKNNLYLTVNGQKKKAVNNARKAARRDRDLVDQMVKAAKQPFDRMIDEIRNMLRLVLGDLSYTDRVAICLYVAVKAAEKVVAESKVADPQEILSDFVAKLLDEEFFLFVLKLGRQKNAKDTLGFVPQTTRDRVDRVAGFANYDEIDFVNGQARGDGDCWAQTDDLMLNGHFALTAETDPLGKPYWYAEKSIRDFVKVPKTDGEKLVFSTGASEETLKRVAALSKVLKPGMKVVLANKVIVDGKVAKDVVIYNGKALFKFKKNDSMEKFYSNLDFVSVGTVSEVISVGGFIVVALDHVRKVAASKLANRHISWEYIKVEAKGQASGDVTIPHASFFRKG